MSLNDTFSGELEVFSGVPQRSILGPLFFLVFIIDLPSCVMSSTFGFADDYKNVGDNPLTLSIDVRRLLGMCDDWVLCEPLDFIPKSFIISIKCDFRPWVSFYIITFFKKRHAKKDIVRAPTFWSFSVPIRTQFVDLRTCVLIKKIMCSSTGILHVLLVGGLIIIKKITFWDNRDSDFTFVRWSWFIFSFLANVQHPHEFHPIYLNGIFFLLKILE